MVAPSLISQRYDRVGAVPSRESPAGASGLDWSDEKVTTSPATAFQGQIGSFPSIIPEGDEIFAIGAIWNVCVTGIEDSPSLSVTVNETVYSPA
ncbi:hypothetical protein Pla52n_68810 [Stieleria varia]|uniref:Uncharacterized protein n=1 Tax=Stieleria varia TaxID=2528005 RepID=A0A5C5ZQQ9_9BACT|nr:hypothetical protein Pla52n_68810 [Stieleria varia]